MAANHEKAGLGREPRRAESLAEISTVKKGG